MNKKALASFAGIFLFLYILNYLTPMCFGDDYLYSFIWQGQPMFVPLGEDVPRVSSWNDLFVSQKSHYLTWGGRTVAHVLAQLFLWIGKDVFNFLNAFIGTLLVAEIYWCINRGRVTWHFKPGTVCWIFFVLWAFTTGFSTVFFWLTAACNYLWTTAILIGFMIPYIKRYYYFDSGTDNNSLSTIGMFIFGIVAGWTNENSVCWVILLLILFIFVYCKKQKNNNWMYAGLIGLIIGYAMLMLAPGNIVRLLAEQKGLSWVTKNTLGKHFSMFFIILFFQIFLWFFDLRAIASLNNSCICKNIDMKKDLSLVKILCVMAFGMTAIMLFSPKFPPRSCFPGVVQLIVSTGILLRMQRDYNVLLIKKNAVKFLYYVGCIYFIVTSTVTTHDFYKKNIEFQQLVILINNVKSRKMDSVLTIDSSEKTSAVKDQLSGLHLITQELSENEKTWINVAFARYYGIKGIRMLKGKEETGLTKTSN